MKFKVGDFIKTNAIQPAKGIVLKVWKITDDGDGVRYWVEDLNAKEDGWVHFVEPFEHKIDIFELANEDDIEQAKKRKPSNDRGFPIRG